MLAMCPRGDLNPEMGEISLNLVLNSETGEKSPDRGVHAAMLTGALRFASTRYRLLAAKQGPLVPPGGDEAVLSPCLP
jgi:hypothetical protein